MKFHAKSLTTGEVVERNTPISDIRKAVERMRNEEWYKRRVAYLRAKPSKRRERL